MENKEEMKKERNEKAKETFSTILKKTSNFSKKAAVEVKKGAENLSKKVKQDNYDRRLKKYNPLFMKDFKSKSFNIPNIIKIVDDAVRRDIDVCDGAIGWTSVVKETGTEVLYLYDEFVKASGIEFIPNVGCDQLYYVDHFNRKRFIKVDCIFERAHSEKIAELERIAYSLGAKSCLIQIDESNMETVIKDTTAKTHRDTKTSGNFNNTDGILKTIVDVEGEKSTHSEHRASRSGQARTYFEGSNTPKRPELKWFANDDNIKGLIEMRCSGSNTIRSRTLILEGSTSATMSQSIAYTIDYLMNAESKYKAGKATHAETNKSSISMVTKAIKENNSKLIFEIEF